MTPEDDESPRGGDLAPTPSGVARLQRFTPARIGLGRVGSGQPTRASLKFLLDHARARDAVHAALDFGALAERLRAEGWLVAQVHSAAGDRTEYLRRPDLGRRLSPVARVAIESLQRGSDVAVIAADGLSSAAIATNLPPTLDLLRPLLLGRGLTIGPLVLVEQGRVAIGDEISEIIDAKLAVVLIGERPGLSAADSLGAYITWRPRVGALDSGRNCISNIRTGGLSPMEGAIQIDQLVGLAFLHAATGVRLNDLRFADASKPAIDGRGGGI